MPTGTSPQVRPPRILVVGGGYVGLYATMRLLRRLRDAEASVTVVDPRSYMTYQPFLPEAAAGEVSPRHVVVPLRRVLRGAEILTGRVTRIEHAQRRVTVQPLEGGAFQLDYDVLVSAVGSVSRTLPIPGLAQWGTGFKTLEEAIQLRNRVLECLDIAESTRDPKVRRRNLAVVVVGGGYAGVEALAELHDMARYATRYFRTIEPEDLRFVLVEAGEAILPEVGPKMGRWTLEQLRQRGVEVRLGTRLESCVDGQVVLSDGTELDAETLIWTAGVRADPVLEASDLPLDERGRLRCLPTLQADGVADAWGAGDSASVPDLTGPAGTVCAPNAQHAVRQSKVLADNIVAVLRGGTPSPYRHRYLGSVAGLGLYQGVANVYGIKVRGAPAWFLHRTYHVSRMPTFNRKVRIVADWTLALFFKREIVSLWSMHEPFHEFRAAAAPKRSTVGGGSTP